METITDLSKIKVANWQLSLSSIGGIETGLDDIRQCIKIALTTRRGDLALDPFFGSGIYLYIDKPIEVARPDLIREIYECINIYEKRVKLTSVSISRDGVASIIVSLSFTVVSSGISDEFKINL